MSMTSVVPVPGRELEGLTGVIAIPTYGPVDPICARDARVAVVHAANRGMKWLNDLSPDRMGWSHARNAVADTVLEDTPADGIMWIDSDMRVPPDAISRLLYHRLDFVAGLYFTRQGPHRPSIHKFTSDGKKVELTTLFPRNSLVPMDACGFGFVWTSRQLLEKIAAGPDFTPWGGWFPDSRDVGGFGEDLSFCLYAKKVGVQLYVDTGIILGHTGDAQVIGLEQYEESLRNGQIGVDPSRPGWGVRK